MAKIGRNEPCPCGSGLKYKKCCLKKESIAKTANQPNKVSITDEIRLLQDAAVARKETIKQVGVFIFHSTAAGDAWLLELSDKDAVLVAQNGEKIDIDITESKETIEIEWSHQFTIEKGKFVTTAYADKKEEIHDAMPASLIKDALRQIEKSFSSDLLNSIHVSDDEK